MTLDYRAGLFAAVLLAATYALGRVRLWLAARRTEREHAARVAAEAERDRAIGTAAAESTARHQREVAAATTTEVAHVAATAAAAHPEDPDAAGAAADQYARERWERLHAHRDAHGGGADDPVPRGPAPGAPARGR